MKIVFLVPENYKSTGGFRLPLDHYRDFLISRGYDVDLLETPYHFRSCTKEYLSKVERVSEEKPEYVIGFSLNQVYILTVLRKRGMFSNCKTYGFMMDCMRLHAESVQKLKVGYNARFKNYLRKLLYTYKERICINTMEKICYVSTVDVNYAKKYYHVPEKKIYYIPNGIDIREFSDSHVKPLNDGIVLGMLSGYSEDTFQENVKPFFEEIWPLVRKTYCNSSFILAGKGASEGQIKYFNEVEGLNYIGYVESLDDFYQQVDCIVTTVSKECGILNRILEAWAYGKTVIGYKKNFATFTEMEDGIDYFSADSAKDFCKVIGRLLNETDLDNKIRTSAYNKTRKYYTWERCSSNFVNWLLS